jgi:magnesium chelatase subunit H
MAAANITWRQLISLLSTLIILLSLGAWVVDGFAPVGFLTLQTRSSRSRTIIEIHSTLSPETTDNVVTTTSSINNALGEDKSSRNNNKGKRDDDDDTAAVNVVLTTGFESFNRDLYQKAGQLLPPQLNVNLQVFADSDIRSKKEEFSTAVQNADLFIGSLIFDYDDVVAVTQLLPFVKGPRLLFECATELMAYNKVGSFNMESKKGEDGSGGSDGPPPAIKAILNKFSSGKEEDKINGYLKMLKVGPDLLKFIPG